jgi:probable addiction module antidote protein
MTKTKTIPWNTEDHLETPEDIAAYLEAVFEDGEPELIGYALGAVARSRGMTEIALRTGLGRQSLYKALPPAGVTFGYCYGHLQAPFDVLPPRPAQ